MVEWNQDSKPPFSDCGAQDPGHQLSIRFLCALAIPPLSRILQIPPRAFTNAICLLCNIYLPSIKSEGPSPLECQPDSALIPPGIPSNVNGFSALPYGAIGGGGCYLPRTSLKPTYNRVCRLPVHKCLFSGLLDPAHAGAGC